MKNNSQNLHNQKDTLQTSRSIVEQLSTELNLILEKYEFTILSNDLIDNLMNRSTTYEKLQARIEKGVHTTKLEQQKAAQFEMQVQTQKKEIDTLSKQIMADKAVLNQLKTERITLFGAKNPKVEQQKFKTQLTEKEALVQESKAEVQQLAIKKSNLENSIVEKENQAKLLRQTLTIKSKKLQCEIQKSGFSDFDMLRKSILPNVKKEAIEVNQKRINNRLLQIEQSLKDNLDHLKKETEQALTTKDKTSLILDNQSFKSKQNELQQQIGKIKNTLHLNELNQAKSAIQLEKIELQKIELSRWSALNELIGQADGQKFRIFAQSLTLKQLVQLANRHLMNLNPRYFIEKSVTEILGLEIVDTFQANTKRAMTTLSGGESFLVSLALALGLSDLAGQNTNIESLFIDEGFGTLDEKTLEDAISTLENLNNFGKTIGIISHVPALKEKISTQIRVIKKGGGVSVLELV